VLEIGFGPGLSLRWALAAASEGLVVGVDPSPVMHRQAARRNAAALTAGRLHLRLGTLEDFPDLRDFDCAFAVNVPAAWADPIALLRLLRLLRPGGRLALTYEPRGPGASDSRAHAAGARIEEGLRSAGFEGAEVRVLPLKPVAAVCVRARRAACEEDFHRGRRTPAEAAATTDREGSQS
jgi:SAM-dependent methyltransferase